MCGRRWTVSPHRVLGVNLCSLATEQFCGWDLGSIRRMGLGIATSAWSNHATYATVGNAESWIWQIPMVGEVWLHEWLHGVCAYFARQGYPMPDGDADGGGSHGYTQSPVSGWTDYYRDLMTGSVLESGNPTGIPLDAWA